MESFESHATEKNAFTVETLKRSPVNKNCLSSGSKYEVIKRAFYPSYTAFTHNTLLINVDNEETMSMHCIK